MKVPILYWQYCGFVLTAFSFIIVSVVYFSSRKNESIYFRKSFQSRFEIIVVLLIAMIGIFLRVYDLDNFLGGELTSDENLDSVITASSVLNFEPTYTGSTTITHILALDLWYHVFGFTPLAARSLSVFISLLGILFYFFALKSLSCARVALWTSALLLISTFGTYFSKLSLVCYWVLFFLPLLLFLYSCYNERQSLFLASVIGLITGIALFTYPGFILGIISLILGWSLGIIILWIRRPYSPQYFVGLGRKLLHLFSGLVFFSIPLMIGYYLHNTVYAGNKLLFESGGSFNFSLSTYFTDLAKVLFDLFIEGRSWYIWVFPKMPFVELTLWPFIIFGTIVLWRTDHSWKLRGIILSIPILILLIPITGPYPGMRRGIFVLPVIYLLSSIGIVNVLDAVFSGTIPAKDSNSSSTSKILGESITTFILILTIIHLLYYEITFAREGTIRNFGTGYLKERIPYYLLLDTLEFSNVYLEKKEFWGYFDGEMYVKYPRLAERYGLVKRPLRKVYFFDKFDEEIERDVFSYDKNWSIITRKIKTTEKLNERGICVDLGNYPKNGILIIIPRKLGSDSQYERWCYEYEDLDHSVLSSMDFAYNDVKSKIIHRMDCEGHYCNDPTRPNFLYSEKTRVSFLIRRPEKKNYSQILYLQFRILYSTPLVRENSISVNGQNIGSLTSCNVVEKSLAKLRVPESVHKEDDIWKIEIKPSLNPKKLGWDFFSAELVYQ